MELSPDGTFNEFGNYRIGGVKSEGSEIKVAFIEPAGSMTGKLLPTGNKKDTITVSAIPALSTFSVTASLVDAANPFIFVNSTSLPLSYHLLDTSAPESLEIVESIRREGSVMCGLAKDINSAAAVRGVPKIAVLSPSIDSGDKATGQRIHVQSYSMGKPHPSFQLTGAVCLGAAMCVEGTVAHDISNSHVFPTPPGTPPNEIEPTVTLIDGFKEEKARIKYSSGEMDVLVQTSKENDAETKIERVSVSRTARRLFEGKVYYIS